MRKRDASIFRSRWVERPAHVAELAPTTLPKGFTAAGVATGGKPNGLDLGLLSCASPECTSAARFTRNALLGAPVALCLDEGSLDALRGVVVNSGNANAAVGERGTDVARAMRDSAARALGVHPHQVGVASTGIIGEPLATDRLIAGIAEAGAKLSAAGGEDFSQAILTTDNGPKRGAVSVKLSAGAATLAAQAKGAGMIAPAVSAATMLCFVETDAAVPVELLDAVVDRALAASFNRTSVDGQMSTSDSIFVLASGASGTGVASDGDGEALAAALEALLLQLALEIVADGEGATKTTHLIVRGASSAGEADRVARAVADSPLVKTALFGGDVNWGRIVQAAGAAVGRMTSHRERIQPTLDFEGIPLCRDGGAVELNDLDRQRIIDAMRSREVEMTLELNRGHHLADVFFSDLSHDYVTLNAEYTS